MNTIEKILRDVDKEFSILSEESRKKIKQYILSTATDAFERGKIEVKKIQLKTSG